MAPLRKNFVPHRVALACAACCAAGSALAQTQLDPVTVTGRVTPPLTVSGWGELPLARLPLQASVYTAERMQDRGAQRLSDLTSFDPSVTDAYNSEGYWDQLTVRGFVLDNRFNYRRDGLPINAETSIPLDNKAQLEVLKGISGMQAGTSAPGGLVNIVVKRPTDEPLRRVSLDWRERATVTGAIDLSDRFGADRAFGVRVNAAAARLDPLVRDTQGSRQLLALAGDWRLSPDTLFEAEIETSHRSQPSQAAFSLLGNEVPAPTDPRLNLNNQPWSLPVVLDADTASLRWRQKLAAGWTFTAHGATQRLRSDDRIAFPFGLDCNETSSFEGVFYCNRYGPDGRFDYYDFRSDNERRRTDSLDLSVQGTLQSGALKHHLTAGLLSSRAKFRFQRQAFNFAGIGNVDGTQTVSPNPALTGENTNRDERSTEWYARDALVFDERWTGWLGVRHTRLDRQSVRTDESRPTDYRQSFTTPFVAASYAYAQNQLVYASWGRGVESLVVPNRSSVYANPGESFTLVSRQAEFGLKGSVRDFEWNLALFDIEKPVAGDIPIDGSTLLVGRPDGNQRHRGLEGALAWRAGPWTLRGGAQWLHARRDGSADDEVNDRQPFNVPQRTLKLQVEHRLMAVRGLTLEAAAQYAGGRYVDPHNEWSIPGYAFFDVAARQAMRIGGRTVVWRAGIDNLTDKRAWRESPYQFSHAYLYPLRPRTAWIGLQADL